MASLLGGSASTGGGSGSQNYLMPDLPDLPNIALPGAPTADTTVTPVPGKRIGLTFENDSYWAPDPSRGMAGTIQTSGLGISGSPTVQKKALLGASA